MPLASSPEHADPLALGIQIRPIPNAQTRESARRQRQGLDRQHSQYNGHGSFPLHSYAHSFGRSSIEADILPAAYTTSKGAVAQLTKQVALDYASERIHCNSICPGFLRTAMTQNLQNDPQKQAELDKAHPFGGMGSPSDVARAALFLACEDAAWVTGVNLPCDGGYTIR